MVPLTLCCIQVRLQAFLSWQNCERALHTRERGLIVPHAWRRVCICVQDNMVRVTVRRYMTLPHSLTFLVCYQQIARLENFLEWWTRVRDCTCKSSSVHCWVLLLNLLLVHLLSKRVTSLSVIQPGASSGMPHLTYLWVNSAAMHARERFTESSTNVVWEYIS